VFLLVRQKMLVHSSPIDNFSESPFKPDSIQHINPILLFATSALVFYPASELGVCFVPLWNTSSSVFLLVRQKTLVHSSPLVPISYSPFKPNSIQKIHPMLLFARTALCMYPNSELGVCFVLVRNTSVLVIIFVCHESFICLHPIISFLYIPFQRIYPR